MNHLESSFKGRNAFWRYLLLMASVLIATNTIGSIPLLISMGKKVAGDPEIAARVAANPTDLSILGIDLNAGLVMMLFPFIIGLATFLLLIKPLNNKTLLTVINGTGSFRWRKFFISAFVWIILSSIYLIAYIKIDPSNFTLNNTTDTLIILVIVSIFLIPFQAAYEEIIYRGYLMQGFTLLVRYRWFPLILTSSLFALRHGLNPEVSEYGFLTMMPQYLLFGLIFGIITILDDGIEAAWGAHAANNIFLCIFVTNESSVLKTPALYVQHTIYPWTEFIIMLCMGILAIFILKIIFRWKDLSVIFKKVEPGENVLSQVP